MALAKNIIITYPVKIVNIVGTTSNKAIQSSALTQFKIILYSIRSVKATKASELTDTAYLSTILIPHLKTPAW